MLPVRANLLLASYKSTLIHMAADLREAPLCFIERNLGVLQLTTGRSHCLGLHAPIPLHLHLRLRNGASSSLPPLFHLLTKRLVRKLRQLQPLVVNCFAGQVADVGAKGKNILGLRLMI